MTESCALNHCQDGLQVYFATETQQYTTAPIYGHYELQVNDVNGRPYFKMGSYGFWYTGLGQWWIGKDTNKGQSYGIAYYVNDVFCPHQLSEFNWMLTEGTSWFSVGEHLGVTCKDNSIQKQNIV